MEFVLDGYCGLYCGACTMVLETKAGIAEKTCYGCKSEGPAGHCATCAIKACAQSKGFDFCYQCADLETCEKMQHFIHDPQYPNGLNVPKNFTDIQRVGVKTWLTDQQQRWQCPNCGTAFTWYDEVCPQCSQPVKSYQADL
jgi:hypothetical protein